MHEPGDPPRNKNISHTKCVRLSMVIPKKPIISLIYKPIEENKKIWKSEGRITKNI